MIGYLLNKSWKIKRELEGVTNTVIDEIYEGCNKLGAFGKLLGSEDRAAELSWKWIAWTRTTPKYGKKP